VTTRKDDDLEELRRLAELDRDVEGVEGGLRVVVRILLLQSKALSRLIDLTIDNGRKLDLLLVDEQPSPPTLTSIQIRFGENNMPGPVTLSQATPNTTASVQGFDQFNAPFAIDFTANPISWAIDDPTLDTFTPNPNGPAAISRLSPGGKTANVSAICAGFSDTEQVINLPDIVQSPVLSSIKVVFTDPTA